MRIRIRKQAPVISYGEEADDILLTARRDPDAAPGDQVLVLRAEARDATHPDWRVGHARVCGAPAAWASRSKRSGGCRADSAGAVRRHCQPDDAADVARARGHRSGSASPATPSAARAPSCAPRRGGRREPLPPAALRLAETVAELGCMRATVHGGLADFERHQDDPEALAGLGFAIRMNNLKVTAARMAPEIVAGALAVCGISGYDATRRTRSAAICATRTARR